VQGTTRAKVPESLDAFCKAQGKSLDALKKEFGFGRGLFTCPDPSKKHVKLFY